MPHSVAAATAQLRSLGRNDADVIDTLAQGAEFQVLDMSGGWAWGQVGDDGFVGYLPLAALVAA